MADANDSRLQEIERSAGTLEGQLRGQIARVENGKRLTLIIGIILIVIIFAYLSWLTSSIKQYANPDDMSGMIATKAHEYAKAQIPEIAKELKAQAPAAVTSLREQITNGVPKLREYAEEQTLVLMDNFTASLEAKVDGIVAEMIKQHKGELNPLIEAAAVKGNDAELEKAFKDSLEELIGGEMDKLFAEFNQDMDVAKGMLAYYAQPDDKLTSAEKVNKELITAVLSFLNEVPNMMPAPTPPTK